MVLTAPDGSILWDGITFTKVVSGGTIDIDCDTPIPAAYVLDGGSKTGTYKVDGSVNGKPRYRLDANHTLEYSGTRWECIHPGSDDQAALGDEAFPWLADWSGTSLTVTQATIGQYCCECPECDPLTVTVNGLEGPTVNEPCGETVTLTVEDSEGDPVTVTVDPLTGVITVPALPCTPSGIAYCWGLSRWSGQDTQYRVGDEKWALDNGFFTYTPPAYPVAYARLVDFFTLAQNNIFGNTLRFTNPTGGAAATTGTRVIVDHLTGLDWYRPASNFGSLDWDNWIDLCLATAFDGGGWIAPPIKTLIDIAQMEVGGQVYTYMPMNLTGSFSLYSGTTYQLNTTAAMRIQTGSSAMNALAKSTAAQQHIMVRRSLYAL